MFKRGTTSNGPPPASSTPSTPPPPKNQQNADASVKSKKVRKTKTGPGPAGSTSPNIKVEKRRKSEQNIKKKKEPAEDSIRKPRKAAEKKKKKPVVKEEDSFEESKRKQKKPKKKSKNIEMKKVLMLKEEEEASERKKGKNDENNSSRRQLQPANVGGPLGKQSSKRKDIEGSERHVRQAATVPAASHPDHSPSGGAPKNNNNNSNKEKNGSDQKAAALGERQKKHSSKLEPNNSSPGSPPPTPGAPATPAAGAGGGNEESEEDDEESSANKTPPDKAEPNEGASDLEPDAATTLKDKTLELAAKGETFTVGALKLTTPEALKGTYGSGMVILKEFDKKIEGYSAGANLTIKFEKSGVKLRRLFMEIEIIKFAHTNQKPGVPRFVDSADHGTFQCLVIDGLGPSLGEIYDKLNGFSASTTFRIALLTLDILRNFHSMLYVHRDIRPHSFFLGKDAANRNKIVLGQMGFAKKFGIRKEIEPEEKCDLEMRKPKYKTKVWHPRKKVTFVGAVRYAPRSSHLHKEHTRRDDMESWFFMIYEFLNKSLPWKTITEKEKILESKETFILDQKFNEDITKKYGSEITNICEYFGVQNFFEMEPDYGYFEGAILNLMRDVIKPGNDKYDWESSPNLFNDRTAAATQSNNNEEGKKTAATTATTKPT